MNAQLKDLIAVMDPLNTQGKLQAVIVHLTTDSRRVVPGSLFFAISGLRTDGNLYIEEAIDRGAIGIVSDKPAGSHRGINYIRVANVKTALARAARHFYGYPDQRLNIAGITGTNGKTTVATLCQHLLAEGDEHVGLIGTIRYDVGHRTFPSFKTTPESVDIQAMLGQMVEADCKQAVMEVSSHGIDQQRVEGLHLDIAVFLNLTQDHLDYHITMEAYFEAKTRIFSGLANQPLPRVAIVNIDDPYGRRLVNMIPEEVELITFGQHANADLRAEHVLLDASGARFEVAYRNFRYSATSPLLGHFNVSNTLAALAVGLAQGKLMDTLLEKLAAFAGVPGRMERITENQPFQVLVDYAHTDDALRNGLSMLRPITKGRLITVFGCGGDRDRLKRPLMMKAVLDGSDLVFATADNPRSEEPAQIFEDMRQAVRRDECGRVTFTEDRRRAIHLALQEARPGDCVLIAGKGHEAFQEFANTLIPFDDRAVARELLINLQLAEPMEET